MGSCVCCTWEQLTAQMHGSALVILLSSGTAQVTFATCRCGETSPHLTVKDHQRGHPAAQAPEKAEAYDAGALPQCLRNRPACEHPPFLRLYGCMDAASGLVCAL